MAIEHAQPGEIIDVTAYGSSLATRKTSTLFKTEQVEVLLSFPLYAYARKRVVNVEEANDLTQAFFERLLEKKLSCSGESGSWSIPFVPHNSLQVLPLEGVGKSLCQKTRRRPRGAVSRFSGG